DTATTALYPLSLHDALPILSLGFCCCLEQFQEKWKPVFRPELRQDKCRRSMPSLCGERMSARPCPKARTISTRPWPIRSRRACRSEEHTSELQSRENLVCRL